MKTTGRPTASLEAAITSLHALETWKLSEADLNAALATMATAWRILGTLIGQYALDADHRDTWREPGHKSVAAMIAHTAPLSYGEATTLVKRRRRLEAVADLHETYQRVNTADTRAVISARHAELITTFLTRYVNQLPDDAKNATVEVLLEYAEDPDTTTLTKAIAVIKAHLDRLEDKPDPGEDRDLDSLHLSSLLNGRYKLDANLNRETAEMLLTLMDAVGSPQTAEEGSPLRRRPEQLRHDVFAELLRRLLASAGVSTRGGARAQVTVIANYESYVGDDEDEPGLFDLGPDANAKSTRTTTDTDTDDAGVAESDPNQLSLFDFAADTADARGDGERGRAGGAGCGTHSHSHGHGHGGCGDEGLWWSGRRGHGANPLDESFNDSMQRLHQRLKAAVTDAPTAAWTGVMSRRQLRKYACDATLRAVLADPTGLPIDLGRTRRVHTAEQRRYLELRDRGCAFPGCGRSPSWCQVHHIVWWSKGGTTDKRNLVVR